MSPAITSRYWGVPPVSDGRYTIGHQRIAEITNEIRPLHASHFAETETEYLDAEFDADYVRYTASEEAGQFVLFTVREGSTLVGYLQYYVFRDMHAQGMYTAREDAFFLLPEHRGKKLAPRVLDYAEDFLQKLGCKYVGMSDKSPVGGAVLSPFLKSRGYREVAIYLVKELT
jgi:GNAT superfamily N-acetyltransferase